ncbi:MAG: hemerythrin domain-containing protein [Nocardioides sp.]|nr:hemerythrin domain-containing protein [Nocardioides sp.]
MTTRSSGAWPRQLRLPGQVAAPEGPVDMLMMYLMHHAFRRDLDAFVPAVRNTPASDRRTWQRLAARWELFAGVLHEHHTTEDDLIWPELGRLAPSEDLATLEAMAAEHTEIDPLLTSCGAGFRRLAQRADEDARAALAVRVTAARESLRRHLAHEESDAIAVIQRVLSAEDWARIEAEIDRGASLRAAVRVVPWVAYGVPRDALDRAFAEVGGPFRLVWLLTRRAFARREARAFRYA